MRKLLIGIATVFALGISGLPAFAAGHGGVSWVLDADASRIAFGSIKKDTVGESHHFETISGTVNGAGDVVIEIDLSSVETWIDIRNERMFEHVFKSMATATLNANVPMDDLMALEVGGMKEVSITGTLGLGGMVVPIEATMFAVRLSEMRVMVMTDEMIFISTADMGVDGGVDMLAELAKLPSITRSIPVTMRLVFDHQM